MEISIEELIKRRYSCRAYADRPIEAADRDTIVDALALLRTGPLGSSARFSLVAATEEDRKALKGLGTYGFIKGATGFIVGAVELGPKDMEDYGYLLERAVLAATDIGLATCWLGGTFSKSAFARKIGVSGGEVVPAVVATGYGAEGARDSDRLRRMAGSDRRLSSEQLFFDEKLGQPLAPADGAGYAEVLEAVRWAPSASNKQPWRVVRSGGGWHFYLQRTQGYGKRKGVLSLLKLADLQRVDMGIAMCHFELVARERGLAGRWVVEQPEPGRRCRPGRGVHGQLGRLGGPGGAPTGVRRRCWVLRTRTERDCELRRHSQLGLDGAAFGSADDGILVLHWESLGDPDVYADVLETVGLLAVISFDSEPGGRRRDAPLCQEV